MMAFGCHPKAFQQPPYQRVSAEYRSVIRKKRDEWRCRSPRLPFQPSLRLGYFPYSDHLSVVLYFKDPRVILADTASDEIPVYQISWSRIPA